MPCWSELRVRTLSVGSSSVVGGTSAQWVRVHAHHPHVRTHTQTHARTHDSFKLTKLAQHTRDVCKTLYGTKKQ